MRVAVFGYGSIGQRHVANLVEMDGHELLIYDLEQSHGRVAPVEFRNDVRDVWPWKPEAVLICTPPSTHADLVCDAVIDHGAHVFVEKPIATTSQLAASMTDAAQAEGLILAVGYNLRFNPILIARHRHYALLTVVHTQDMSTWPSQYQKDVLEEFSHELDLAVFFNGPVVSVVARQQGLQWEIDLRHQLSTSKITLDAGGRHYVRYVNSEIYGNQFQALQSWMFDKRQNDQAYKDELAAFLAACQGQPWDPRLCRGAEAVHVVKIIEACRESAERCKVVTLA